MAAEKRSRIQSDPNWSAIPSPPGGQLPDLAGERN